MMQRGQHCDTDADRQQLHYGNHIWVSYPGQGKGTALAEQPEQVEQSSL